VRDPRLDQFQFYRPDSPVIHIAWGDAVRAGFRIRHGDVADPLDRERVVQTAVFVQDAAVAVRGVFAQTHVDDDVERRKGGFQELNGVDDGAVRVVGGGAEGVFEVGL